MTISLFTIRNYVGWIRRLEKMFSLDPSHNPLPLEAYDDKIFVWPLTFPTMLCDRKQINNTPYGNLYICTSYHSLVSCHCILSSSFTSLPVPNINLHAIFSTENNIMLYLAWKNNIKSSVPDVLVAVDVLIVIIFSSFFPLLKSLYYCTSTFCSAKNISKLETLS